MLKRILVSVAFPIFMLALALPVSAEEIIADAPSVAPDLGQEANIITAFIKQPSVKMGESVTVDVMWYPINGYQVSSSKDKDAKPLSANLSITDGAGNFCADPVWKTVFSEYREFSISAVATRDCDRLYARIALIDADQKLLDAVDITTDEKMIAKLQAPIQEMQPAADAGFLGNISPVLRLAIVAIGIITLVGLIAILGRNILRRRSLMTMLLPLLLALPMLMSGEEAKGATWSVGGVWTYTADVDRHVVSPGEQINVSGNIVQTGANIYGLSCDPNCYTVVLSASIDGNSADLIRTQGHSSAYTIGETFFGSASIQAPSTPGTYTITYTGGYISSIGAFAGQLISVPQYDTITVSAPAAVPGICGTANGGSFSTAPSSSLCVTGTPSWTDSTAADNTFNWNCVGSNGGITTSCMANKTTATTAAACGTANGGTFASAPTSNLCSLGNASAVYDYGYWSWTCSPTLCYTVLTMYSGYVTMCMVSGPSTIPVSCAANKGAAVALPTVSFWADNASLVSGGSTTLHWTSTDATSCTASGSWAGAKAVTGTETTGVLSANQTYNIACTGPGGTSPTYTVTVNVTPATPTVDLKVNSSDGPVTLASGATKNLSWTATNATSCTASGVDAFTGSKSVPNGSETLTVSRTSTDMLTCTGPGGTASDSVQINATCTPSTGTWDACDCSTETKTRTNINASCLPWTESDACTIDEKNSCRDFNWKEVAP